MHFFTPRVAHTNACDRQADIWKLARPSSGKGKYISNTFRRRADANTWALETECTIDEGFDLMAIAPSSVKTFGEIIDLHIQDMQEVGKKIRRSKSAVLESLKLTLGNYKLREITRNVLIDYGKKGVKQGAGPATLAIDFSIGTLLTHTAAVHGIAVNPDEVRWARVALKRLDSVGGCQQAHKRPPYRRTKGTPVCCWN